MPSIPERVAKGAALLDEKLPGWHERIELKWLDLNSCRDCVLGQTYEDYDYGIAELFTDGHRGSIAHGFTLSDDDENEDEGGWVALTTEWRRVILARRGGAQ